MNLARRKDTVFLKLRDHGFVLLRVGLAAAVIFLCVCLVRDVKAQECTLQRLAEYPILPNKYSSPVISVLIDDQPRRLMLDTGAAWGMLSYSIVGNQKLKNIDGLLYVGGGAQTINSYARMDSVKIGSVDFKGVDFFVGSPGIFGGTDGTLGVDFLGSLDVEIDSVKNEVDFFLPNTCGDRVVHWPHSELVEIPLDNKNRDKHIQVTLVLDGKEIPAIIDTGSSETFISWHLAEHLFDLNPKSPGVRALEEINPKYDAEKQAYRYQFKNLSVGDIAFSNPLITIIPMMSNGPQMVLGMHELHGLHLYFSYGQQKLYVTTARGDLAAAPSQIPQHPNPLEQINAKNYLDMASSELAVKDYDVALKEADAALRLDPGLGFAYLARGEADHFKGNRDQALEDAAKANQSTPDDPGIYLTDQILFFDRRI